jgi:glycerophosphoryl diester phosphodiesterase
VARCVAVTVITFAHRGARLEAPENTIPAFRLALEAGASGLETDVWCSSDGQVVCAHDAVAGRGLRRKRIVSSTAADLATMGVPRLADVYEDLGTAFEVAAAHGALPRLWACAPDLELLRKLRGINTETKLVHSTHKRAIGVPIERHAFDLSEIGVDAMNMHHTEWTAGLVSLFHRFGVKAFAWDTQETRHIRAVLKMGIDAVYCDRPDRMVATVSEWVPDA